VKRTREQERLTWSERDRARADKRSLEHPGIADDLPVIDRLRLAAVVMDPDLLRVGIVEREPRRIEYEHRLLPRRALRRLREIANVVRLDHRSRRFGSRLLAGEASRRLAAVRSLG
jgi:hypothetical protein